MSAPLIIPEHIKQARLTAVGAGISMEANDPGFAALMFAAIAYNRLHQGNKAEVLRQQCLQTQRELENVSSELLNERKKVARLTSELTELRHKLAAAPMPSAPSQKMTLLKQQIASLRNELTRRPAHTNEPLPEQLRALQVGRDRHQRTADKQRKYLRHIQRRLLDTALPLEERLAEVGRLVGYGLSVGEQHPDS